MKKQITILDTDKRNVAENMIQSLIMTLLASTVNKMREENKASTKIRVKVNSKIVLILFIERYKLDENAIQNLTLADFFRAQKEFVQFEMYNPNIDEFVFRTADLQFNHAETIAQLLFNASFRIYAKTKAHELNYEFISEF